MGNDITNKLFTQYPFIYMVDDLCYGFGQGECMKFSPVDQSAAKYQLLQLNKAIDRGNPEPIRQLFNRIKSFTAACAKEHRSDLTPDKEFDKFHFSTEQINQLEPQIVRYNEIYQKYVKPKSKFD